MAAEAAESPLSRVISQIFHLKPEHGGLPQGILPLSGISDHFPFPVTYNIGGITLNAISWNIMANATLRRRHEFARDRAKIIMDSLKYYIARLLHLNRDLIHILLFQEYGKWEPPLNQLSPMGLLGSEGEDPPRIDVSAWGVLHSYGNPMSCRPGLLTYYNKMALHPLGVIPYIIYNNNLRRGDRAAIPSPYLGEIPHERDDLEKNLVLILKLPAHLNTIFVIQNTHRSRDEKLSYTKHILNYFKRGEQPGEIMRWTGRPEASEASPFPTDHRVVVSIIGDFNYTPYALSGNVVAPADIQDKLHGDYAPDDANGNSSFGNYLYKHAREERFDDPADAYQDIIFRSIDQYRDPNIREALFQIREGEPIATSGLVPCFSHTILSRRRKEDDILGIERLSQGRRTQSSSWRAAPPRVQQRETRRAEDGKYYTRQEFIKYYGQEGANKWDRARGRRPGTQDIKPKTIIHKKRKRHKLNSKSRTRKRKKSLKKQKRNNRTKKRRYR